MFGYVNKQVVRILNMPLKLSIGTLDQNYYQFKLHIFDNLMPMISEIWTENILEKILGSMDEKILTLNHDLRRKNIKKL